MFAVYKEAVIVWVVSIFVREISNTFYSRQTINGINHMGPWTLIFGTSIIVEVMFSAISPFYIEKGVWPKVVPLLMSLIRVFNKSMSYSSTLKSNHHVSPC